MPVKVFISHKNEDTVQAGAVAAHLQSNGLNVYLDVIDRQLDKSGPDLADYIRQQLEQCTQLLAVISPRTQASWWVPWEIGVATEKERFLASFVSDNATVPEFLVKWPYMRTKQDLDIYIRESKKAQLLVEERLQRGYPTTARATGFRSFHTSMKASLGQR
ncbi:toll/interleukin-1 receptor domain-containing protein [Afipia birgiae]|uniref:toll/interleukin-1 receptor domain-containing protein n=1 Tax=Afipia birgiae TaxID=151414 RepID=UPI00036406AB|nr:toll/interleukin-1 receptor domain-containing protein [Afipia birgiae]MBX9822475.1 toll/interleukin-1 receptor domain-containing protein [Afipia birgiae]